MSRFAINTDTIFFFSKSDKYFFKTPKVKNINNDSLNELYNKIDENGRRYKSEPIELPKMMARKNLIFKFKDYVPEFGWMMNIEKLIELDNQNKIYFSKNGKPRRKNFLDDYEGSEIDNIWVDIQPIGQVQNEIIGYPTQKPEALMQRIIECASNEGDTIMDPFVGGGTTIAVADKLHRNWIGIDQSVQAIKVTEYRLNKQNDLFSKPFIVQLHKYDYDTLRNKHAFEFETWIVQQYGGTANIKQRNDLGLDGKTNDNTPIQVKRSDNIGRNVVDNFLSAVQRYDKKLFDKNVEAAKPVGFIIAFSFGKGAIEEVARLKNKEGINIKLVTVEEIVPISKKPTITIEVNELGRDQKGIRDIGFIAIGSSAAGIEFYSWDFDYHDQAGFKAGIFIDKTGVQQHKFSPGIHNIAVKVVDNDGLDNIEVIKLKINGTIEKM